MSQPNIPQKGPYRIDESPGKKIWCACGKSAKQPYCDGAHSSTDMFPLFVHIEKQETVSWCGCKQTKTPPYCDGSHEKLP